MQVLSDTVTLVPVAELVPHPENPNRGNVDSIRESIETNGFYGVVVAQQSTNRILIGEHRWRAAADMGAESVPVMLVDVDDVHARRIMLADNRTAELAARDPAALSALLNEVVNGASGLLGTGYQADDLNRLMASIPLPDLSGVGSTPAVTTKPANTPVIQYNIVFDNEDQQTRWYAFVRSLREQYPEATTLAKRLDAFLAAQG